MSVSKSQLFCSDHVSLSVGADSSQHLVRDHKPGSFIIDRLHPNVYYVLLPNGTVKKTGYSGVSKVLSNFS